MVGGRGRFLRDLVLFTGAVAALITFWWPAAGVPFWQDDYDFLLAARSAGLDPHGPAFWALILPDPAQSIWRPIGAGLWWRLAEGPLGGEARAAHVAGLLLLVAAAAAVGWLAAIVRRLVEPGNDGRLAGLAAGLLYGLHGAHVLPVAWSSAVNHSLLVLFGALALAFWIAGSTAERRARRVAWLWLALLCLVLALLSRESAVVLPALGAVLTCWLRPFRRPSPGAWPFAAAAVAITAVWILLRAAGTAAPSQAYELHAGMNVARNAVSLALFAINTPREAMRFLVVDPSPGVAVWGAACAALQATALVLLVWLARPRLDRRGRWLLAAFFIVACGPYFLLAWNAYEYYAGFGLLAYAIVAGLAAARSRLIVAAGLLALMSSGIFMAGTLALDYPGLIGRAHWAERQLRLIETWRETMPWLSTGPIQVRIEQPHKFQAIGVAGLAYRLGFDRDQIIAVGAPAPAALDRPVLVVPAEGDVYVTASR